MQNTFIQDDTYFVSQLNEVDPRIVYRLVIFITWLWLAIPIHTLLTYSSGSSTVWERYSVAYATGLVIYITGLLSFPLLLLVPERLVQRLFLLVNQLRTNAVIYLVYTFVCLLLSSFLLILIRFWGWGYLLLLQIDIILLGFWMVLIPVFWEWSVQGWPLTLAGIGRLIDRITHSYLVWLKPVLIVGTPLVVLAIAYIGNQLTHQLVIILPFVVIAVLILIKNTRLGYIALIGTLLIPINGPSGVNATMGVVAILIGLQILKFLTVQKKVRLVKSRPITPLGLFILFSFVSFGVGLLPWYTFAPHAPLGAQLGTLAIYLLSAGIFLLVANQIRDTRWLFWLMGLILTLMVVYCIGWVLPSLRRILHAPYRDIGSMIWLWSVVLPFSQALLNKKLHLKWRLILGLSALFIVFTAYFYLNDWNSGWVPAVLSILAVVAFRYWKISLIIAPFVVIPIFGIITYLISNDSYSWGTRVDAWLIVIEIAKVNPIFGLGPANYRWYTPLFPIRGYSVFFVSHSQYVDIYAQTGIVGLALFVWFFVEIGLLAWRLKDRVPEGFPQAYVYGILGGLVATLVSAYLGDWVLGFFYNVGMTGFRASMLPWLFFGGLIALEKMYISTSTTDNNPAVEGEIDDVTKHA